MGLLDFFMKLFEESPDKCPEPDDAAFLIRGPAMLRGQQDRYSVSGDALGPWISFRYIGVVDSSDDRNSPATEILVELPTHYPLLLSVRRRTNDERDAIERGREVSFPSGDADFDRQFLVEGAPFDVVKLLFDARARQLMHHMRDELSTTDKAPYRLRMVVGGWLEGHQAREVLEEFVSLVGRIRGAYGEAEAAILGDRKGFAFREEADDETQRAAAAEREAQVERTRRMWARRKFFWER
jgi:hypothetical protein